MPHLLKEKMVGKMIEHHRTGRIYCVGLGEKLHPFLDGVMMLAVQLQDSQAYQSTNALWAQLQGSLECKFGLFQVPKFHEAYSHSQPY